MALQSYRELVAWQKAMDLVEMSYRTTVMLPREETYGLRSQMRSDSVSIPSNIAEGQGRRTTGEFLNSLSHAYGSLLELETQATICRRLSYFKPTTEEQLLAACAEVGRLINGLSNSLVRG